MGLEITPAILSSGVTGRGDSNYNILATDRTVITNANFTAARTWTLPAANSVTAGQPLAIIDSQGTVTATNTLSIARNGSDTINSGTGSATLTVAHASFTLISDGISNWSCVSDQNVDLQVFTSTGAGIWTKPTWFAPSLVKVIAIGGGGGGGQGGSNTGAAIRMGGAGGGGGSRIEKLFLAADLGVTENISVGTGGSGGSTGGSGAIGQDGSTGGPTTFGSTNSCKAGGGGGGRGGAITAAAGSGGGGAGIGNGLVGGTASVAGGTPGALSLNAIGNQGGAGSITATQSNAENGGGGGGGHDSIPSLTVAGGSSYWGGGGGGCGTCATATPSFVTASKGGGVLGFSISAVNGTAGTDGASPTGGGQGAGGNSKFSGEGGGGGGGTITANTAGAAGGNGGAPGGGGGGGGCGTNTGAGGIGATGGRGQLWVWTW